MKSLLNTNSIKVIIALIASCAWASCGNFLDVPLPTNKLTTGTVFNNDATATAAALSMYDMMQRLNSFGASGAPNSIATLCGIYSDELKNYYSPNDRVAKNDLSAQSTSVQALWSSLYSTIYLSNAVIEGVEQSSGVSESTKRQLLGEAKVVRAFCHFYLVNLYGDVPYLSTTNFEETKGAARQAESTVYENIVQDLKDAKAMLDNTYVSEDRCRPNRSTATALLSRVYLFTHDWANAEKEATEIINSPDYVLEPLDDVFKRESREALWQLASSAPSNYTTNEGTYFILTSAPQISTLSDTLLQSFEASDLRAQRWVAKYTSGSNEYPYNFKYKAKGATNPALECSVIFRLAELYLIRAEARMRQGNISGNESGTSDMNMIRDRAGLLPTTASTQDELLAAIQEERRVELFAEWGHRWFDLKRTSTASSTLRLLKPKWTDEDLLFPIPENELNNDPNLKPQNPGY